MKYEDLKDSYPKDHSTPCPKITEDGWELIGEELQCFGSLEDPDQSDEEEASSVPPTSGQGPVHHSIGTDVEMTSKTTEDKRPTQRKPVAKRTRATGSQETGSTQASQDNLEAAKNSRLPDSDGEKEA